MFEHKHRPVRFIQYFLCLMFILLATASAETLEVKDDKIIERYKLMLEHKPTEGSTFDRLYHFYVEGPGLEQMVADYQTLIEAEPNSPNLQLILGHILNGWAKIQKPSPPTNAPSNSNQRIIIPNLH